MNVIQQRLEAIRGLTPLDEKQCATLDIKSIKQGGYFELNDETYRVESLSQYLDVKWKNFKKRSQDYWITELKLFSLNSGKTVYLEWEEDDELEICQTDKEIKLRDIHFDGKPITHNAIAFIEDEEYGEVQINGKTYHYSDDDTWAGLFYADSKKEEGIPVRCYEFESDAGDYLTIEMWQQSAKERPEREAFLSHSVNSRSINILQTTGS